MSWATHQTERGDCHRGTGMPRTISRTLVKHRFLGSIPRARASAGLGSGISNKFPGDAEVLAHAPCRLLGRSKETGSWFIAVH